MTPPARTPVATAKATAPAASELSVQGPAKARQVSPPQKAATAPDDTKKVSIKDIIAGTKPVGSVVGEPEQALSAPEPDREFTREELMGAWVTFASEIKEESPRISVTLSSVSPELLSDGTVILRLDNTTLREAFDQNFKARLEGHLRRTLQNGTLKLQTIVESTERGEILYSPEQKFNHLAARNPALKDLKKTFNLDFE